MSTIVSIAGVFMIGAGLQICWNDRHAGWAAIGMFLLGLVITSVGVTAIQVTAIYDYKQEQEEK
jgi:hypothetical protein